MSNGKYLGTESLEQILQIIHDELQKKSDTTHGHSNYIGAFIGKSHEEKTVYPTKGNAVTAAYGGEFFNDYSDRVYNDAGDVLSGNVAAGEYSTVMGFANTAIGKRDFIIGYNNLCTSAQSFIGGESNTDSYSGDGRNFIFGYSNKLIQGKQSIIIGESNTLEYEESTNQISNNDLGCNGIISQNSTCKNIKNTAVFGKNHTLNNLFNCLIAGQSNTVGGSSARINESAVFGYSNTIDPSSTLGYVLLSGSFLSAKANWQTIFGIGNKESTDIHDKLIIGGGTTTNNTVTRSNIFRVHGTSGVYAAAAYHSSGADYAEMFEWEDGNENNEDRIGKFVTLNGDKIKLTESSNDFILGIVSGNASVIGDSYDDQWNGMYETDEFGRFILETIEDENGIHVEKKIKDSYNKDETYIPRSERKEWSAVGIMGKLVVYHDGSAQVNGYVTAGAGGIATNSEIKTRYRVMKVISNELAYVIVI